MPLGDGIHLAKRVWLYLRASPWAPFGGSEEEWELLGCDSDHPIAGA